MATKTQIKFKKEMKKLAKEMKNNDVKNKEFYSFIKKDMINSYYNNKGKKAIIKTISLGSILILLWNSFAIYTWVKPLLKSQIDTSKTVSLPTINLSKTLKEDTIIYLKHIKYLDSIFLEYQQYFDENFSLALKDSNNAKNFIDKMSLYSNDIQILYNELLKELVPDDLIVHKELLINKCNMISNLLIYSIELVNSNNETIYNYNLLKYNDQILKLQSNSKELHNELIKIFEKVGFEYKITENGISYWYAK